MWVKSNVVPNEGWWGNIAPENPQVFFTEFQERIEEFIEIADDDNIDVWLLTNELQSLTTNQDNKNYFFNLIDNLNNNYDFEIGLNVKALNNYHYEWKQISHLTEKLDLIGLSVYFTQIDVPDYPTVDDIKLGLTSYNDGGDEINIIDELNQYISQSNIPIYITEYGAYPYKALKYITNQELIGEPISLETQQNFYEATLDIFENQVVNLGGVFPYCWSEFEYEPCISPAGIRDSKKWSDYGDTFIEISTNWGWIVNYSPSLETISKYFTNSD